jgi:hypothetical protein
MVKVLLGALLLLPVWAVGSRAFYRELHADAIVGVTIIAAIGVLITVVGLVALVFVGYSEDGEAGTYSPIFIAIPALLIGPAVLRASWVSAGREQDDEP